jgi:hypothetical protein
MLIVLNLYLVILMNQFINRVQVTNILLKIILKSENTMVQGWKSKSRTIDFGYILAIRNIRSTVWDDNY